METLEYSREFMMRLLSIDPTTVISPEEDFSPREEVFIGPLEEKIFKQLHGFLLSLQENFEDNRYIPTEKARVEKLLEEHSDYFLKELSKKFPNTDFSKGTFFIRKGWWLTRPKVCA